MSNKSFDNNIQIITKEKVNLIQNIFSSYKKCNIFGKGPTLRYISKDENNDTLFVCINDTINIIKECDLLVCNDIESFDKIDSKYLKNCKNILIPYHIHYMAGYNPNITYIDVIEKIKDHFTGNLLIYNLRTANKNYDNYISLSTALTSTHTGFEFIINFIKNIDQIDFYGFAKKATHRSVNLYKNIKDEQGHFKRYSEYRRVIEYLKMRLNKNLIVTYN